MPTAIFINIEGHKRIFVKIFGIVKSLHNLSSRIDR